LGSTAGSISKIFTWCVGTLTALDIAGITITPLLAGAGIAAAALGFGAQSLVRDFLSGFFIIAEDQYGIGDVVRINEGTISGTVEEVTLRHTRLRGVDGVVHYVPNGEIRVASNASMEWSRALLDITILPSNDIDRALELFSEEIRAVVTSEAWAPVVSDDPLIAGVDAQSRDGVTLRAWVKTTPTDQYPLQRELRRAVVQRFRNEGVLMPEAASPLGGPTP
jgi:small conductance mechanosensitive channel